MHVLRVGSRSEPRLEFANPRADSTGLLHRKNRGDAHLKRDEVSGLLLPGVCSREVHAIAAEKLATTSAEGHRLGCCFLLARVCVQNSSFNHGVRMDS